MVAPIRRQLLADQAAELLVARISAMEWQIGEKIPGETALAEELGVGRSTVREAVRTLASAGMLESRQGSGVYLRAVRPPTDWDRTVRTQEILHVVEVRNAVETDAARLASLRRTPGDVVALRSALDGRSAAVDGDAGAFVDADLGFHRAVVEAAHNPVLANLFETFVPRLRTAMIDLMTVLGVSPRDEPDVDLHLSLVEAIEKGDPEDAVRISIRHLGEMTTALNALERS
ncbi:FadR/GntR family transcriptional regulator [Rhodococcus sp. NPDC058521]|uniref:FadR/GntR family transcriptional regulator n=1 Tax=Rhodococcus sp. NPDC058521 TaxID=3346536 RepID=UPI003663ED09